MVCRPPLEQCHGCNKGRIFSVATAFAWFLLSLYAETEFAGCWQAYFEGKGQHQACVRARDSLSKLDNFWRYRVWIA